MISGTDILEAVPVIASLIVIESLLSVDNALAIAALASHLPPAQRKIAMRLGIGGAYLFRGLAMAAASWIVHNEWIRIIGAGYLIYLMCAHLTAKPEESSEESKKQLDALNTEIAQCREERAKFQQGTPEYEAANTKVQAVKPRIADAQAKLDAAKKNVPKSDSGLFATVMKIELLDLSLSIDNVIAAVAMSRKLWIVCTGVFIGILALRYLAGYCLRLLERYPILAKTAFILVGWVGVILVFEMVTGEEVQAYVKFLGIGGIIVATIFYERHPRLKRVMAPLISGSLFCMRVFAVVIDFLVWPLRKIVDGICFLFTKVARADAAK